VIKEKPLRTWKEERCNRGILHQRTALARGMATVIKALIKAPYSDELPIDKF
jgi:hypothetical protein